MDKNSGVAKVAPLFVFVTKTKCWQMSAKGIKYKQLKT